MKTGWTKWLWLVFLPGGSIIVVVIVQLIAKTPLNTSLNSAVAGSFLATVAQVLAGILAIVFSVSVLAVDIATDKYSPRLFSYFAKSWATQLSFFSILALTILSVVAMGVQDVPMSQWRYLFMTGLFAFCLLTLPYYFYQTLQLLDPRNLAERIRNEGLRSLKKQDQQKTLDAITSLGDIAIKALGREEDEITKRYLDALQEIEQEIIITGVELLTSNTKKDIAYSMFGFGIRSPILEQYFRVYKVAVTKRNEDITLYIVNLLRDTIDTLTGRSNNQEPLKGRLRQYEDFAKIAIENEDVSRFSLVRILRDVVLPRSFPDEFITEDYAPFILEIIRRSNQAIIDHQDFALWKSQLSSFSTALSMGDIYFSLITDVRELLLRHEFSDSDWPWWEKMDRPLETRITPTNKRLFELGLSRMMRKIPVSDQDLQEKMSNVKKLLYKLWATTGVYDVFFSSCAYALYRGQSKYVKELWQHVNPKDSSGYWVNINLIRFKTGFLTTQMVSQVWMPDEFEDYHSSEVYAIRYYLLCLAHTLVHSNHDWHPVTPFLFEPLLDQDEEYSETMREELRAAYAFLINLPSYADKALAQYETVSSEKEEWEDVFDDKISEALEQARDWLSDTHRRQEWTSKAEGIIRDLPLDDRRVEAYRKSALEYYKEESQIKFLAIQDESTDKQNSTELTGRWRFQNPDKQQFTLIGLNEPERIGASVGFVAIHDLVRLEVSHIAKVLLTENEQETVHLEEFTFDSILKSVEKIKQAGYAATVLIAPGQEISSAWLNDHQFRVNVRYENQKERYLQIDADTKLKIIELLGDYAFIFDGGGGTWTTINPLAIEVKECNKDPLSVKISGTETIKFQMPNPQAIEILKLNQQKDTQ